jgi:hypothetical protein
MSAFSKTYWVLVQDQLKKSIMTTPNSAETYPGLLDLSLGTRDNNYSSKQIA